MKKPKIKLLLSYHIVEFYDLAAELQNTIDMYAYSHILDELDKIIKRAKGEIHTWNDGLYAIEYYMDTIQTLKEYKYEFTQLVNKIEYSTRDEFKFDLFIKKEITT